MADGIAGNMGEGTVGCSEPVGAPANNYSQLDLPVELCCILGNDYVVIGAHDRVWMLKEHDRNGRRLVA